MVHPEVKFLGRTREREKVIRFQKGRGKITTADSEIVVAFLCNYTFPVR